MACYADNVIPAFWIGIANIIVYGCNKPATFEMMREYIRQTEHPPASQNPPQRAWTFATNVKNCGNALIALSLTSSAVLEDLATVSLTYTWDRSILCSHRGQLRRHAVS